MSTRHVIDELVLAAQASTSSLPEKLRAHLHQCTSCKALWEFLTGKLDAEDLPQELQSKLDSVVLSDLQPVKPVPSAGVLALLFGAVFAVLSAVFIFLSGTSGAQAQSSVQLGAILGVVCIAATALAVWLSGEMIPATKRFITPAGLFTIICVGLFLAVLGLFEWQQENDLFAHGWHCFRVGVLTTLPASALLILVLNRGAVLSFAAVGAGAGLMAGLVGVVTLQLGCTMTSAPHIMVGHLTIPLVAAAAGYFIGKAAPLLMTRPS